MSEQETVRYGRDRKVAIITIHRPDAMNSFNTELRADLLAAFERAAGEDEVRVVVLTGEGRSFSAGADLKGSLMADRPVDQQLQLEYRPIFECIAAMRQPVIAAVGGSAAGIGMSYALACDLLVMADNAFLLSPFSTISLVPDGGLNWLLVHQLGYRRAFQLAVEAERISAQRCVELGLANRAVPAAGLREAAVWGTGAIDGRRLAITCGDPAGIGPEVLVQVDAQLVPREEIQKTLEVSKCLASLRAVLGVMPRGFWFPDPSVRWAFSGLYFAIFAMMFLAFLLSICSSVDAFVVAGFGGLGLGPVLAFLTFDRFAESGRKDGSIEFGA